MDAKVKKIAALAVAGIVAATSVGSATPALAGGWGWGHGGWGHHWHHGGWGHNWGYGWRGHRGYGWGAPVAAGVIGALAIGAAAAASQPYYYDYYGYGGCYLARQPIVDDWGDVVAYRRVRVCN